LNILAKPSNNWLFQLFILTTSFSLYLISPEFSKSFARVAQHLLQAGLPVLISWVFDHLPPSTTLVGLNNPKRNHVLS